MATGRRLNDGLGGLRTAITIAALAATVIGWALLAGDREVPTEAPLPPATEASDVAPTEPGAPSAAPALSLAPMPSLVSVDTRPLPSPRAPSGRPDVTTRASRRR